MSETEGPSAGERLYRLVLYLYPPRFRERFGEEMLDAYRAERAAGESGFLLRDLAVSLGRSWAGSLRKPSGKEERRTNAVTVDRDLAYALRALRSQRAFSLAIVATLTLGIGAVVSVYSVFRAVLLKPLPYPSPDRLVRLWDRHETVPFFSVSVGNFLTWRDEVRRFDELGAYREDGFNLLVDGDPLRVPGARVTASLLRVLGIEPSRGRNFLDEEDRPGGDRVVLLTHGLWSSAMGADPSALGRTLVVSGEPHTVVGILPPDFVFPQQPKVEILVPFAFDATDPDRSAHFLRVLGRLRPGARVEDAGVELATLAERMAGEFPGTNEGWTVAVLPLHEAMVEEVTRGLRVLFIAVVVVFLIAGANVSNLALTRAFSRSRELALRSALGAGRRRLAGQLVVEHVFLALLGGLGGLVIAWGVISATPSILPESLPRQAEISLDAHLFAFGFLLAALTGVAVGAWPALVGSRSSLVRSLKASWGGTRVRSILVTVEVGLAVMLLVTAGLLLRTLGAISRVELGFDPESVLTMEVTPVEATYPGPADRAGLYREILARVEALPGVVSAAAVHRLPLDGGNSSYPAYVEGRPPASGNRFPAFNYRAVGGDYFEAFGMTLLSGRSFDPVETWETGGVVVVNEAMAASLWPGGGALGSRLGPSPDGPWLEVIGIVGNARESSLDEEPEAAMYLPYSVAPVPTMVLVARTIAFPLDLVRPVRSGLAALDPRQPVAQFGTLRDHVDDALGPPRFHAVFLSTFAVLALALAAVGIHSVISSSVRQRRQEIGIRMALGARAGHVLAMTWRSGMTPVAAGVALGLGAALVVSWSIESFLFGVDRLDPLSFLGFPLVLVVVAAAANFFPARAAAAIDPIETLRTE
ncbi:MAG TPA: ABC transporter permease [Vicinamibacteria bacterium]|nr:ABC transporter permease [Vicinamibacteria bacterium]